MDKYPVAVERITGEFMEIVNATPAICMWAEELLPSGIFPHHLMYRSIKYTKELFESTGETTYYMGIERNYLSFGCFMDYMICLKREKDIPKIIGRRY